MSAVCQRTDRSADTVGWSPTPISWRLVGDRWSTLRSGRGTSKRSPPKNPKVIRRSNAATTLRPVCAATGGTARRPPTAVSVDADNRQPGDNLDEVMLQGSASESRDTHAAAGPGQ